ncbi:MAG: hypothetical protein EBT83_10805, partial [Betaproteobacteria bacterium]|nr:hypothetical protein [Betaproteobacteria bacterium]
MKPLFVARWTGSGKQVFAMFALALCAAVAQAQQSIGNTLTTNKALENNQMLESTNKNYKAVMQGDGNFVVYRAPSTFIWASGSNGPRAANGKLVMQGDGNVCITTAANGNVWCNFSNGPVGNYFLILRDSGDLEVYNGTPANTAAATLVWTTLLDPNYYANRYADLKQAFGSDARRLMDHWVVYGRFEGRSPKNGISDEGR